MNRLAQDLLRVLRMKSTCSHGNEELVNYLAANMKEIGLHVELQPVFHSFPNISKRQFNLISILGDPLVEKKIKKGLLLLSHLDTAEPGLSENWTVTHGDPYQPIELDGKIYGLGAASSKVDFMCKLAAVKQFIGKKLKAPIYLVGSCGGEFGMFGGRYLLQSLSVNPKHILVGMPTSLKLIHQHHSVYEANLSVEYQVKEKDSRGFNRRVSLVTRGKNSHSADPSGSQSGLNKALQFLRKATNNGFELRLAEMSCAQGFNQAGDQAQVVFFLTAHQYEDFKVFFSEVTGDSKDFRVEYGGLGDIGVSFLPEEVFRGINSIIDLFHEVSQKNSNTSLCLTQIHQQKGKLNLIFDFRISDSEGAKEVFKSFQDVLMKEGNQYPSLNLSIKNDLKSPGLNYSPDHDWYKVCQAALKASGIPLHSESLTLGSEAGIFQQKNFDVLVFGPGQGLGNSHAPNEYVLISEVEKAIQFYVNVIEKACL